MSICESFTGCAIERSQYSILTDARVKINIHHYLHFEDSDLKQYIKNLLTKESNKIMATIVELTAAVKRNTDVDESVLTMLAGIVQQLKDAQASNDPVAMQTLIDQLDANTQKMADAVTANTPQPPVVL